MPLTDTAIRAAKTRQKPYKLSDEQGLHSLVQPAGSKFWRLKYRLAGKEKLLAVGSYPEIPLNRVRDLRAQVHSQLADGVDPGHAKKATKLAAKVSAANTFEAVAREWLVKYADTWTPDHVARILRRFEDDGRGRLSRHRDRPRRTSAHRHRLRASGATGFRGIRQEP